MNLIGTITENNQNDYLLESVSLQKWQMYIFFLLFYFISFSYNITRGAHIYIHDTLHLICEKEKSKYLAYHGPTYIRMNTSNKTVKFIIPLFMFWSYFSF